MFPSPSVFPREPLRRLAKVLALCRRVIIVSTVRLATRRLESMPRASPVRLLLRGGVLASPAQGVVIRRPAGRPRGRHGGGPASLAAVVPGPIPVTSPNDPITARHEVAIPEALEDGIALLQVMGPQDSACVRLFVGLGSLVAELCIGVATVPLKNRGCLGPHAHESPSPVLRLA